MRIVMRAAVAWAVIACLSISANGQTSAKRSARPAPRIEPLVEAERADKAVRQAGYLTIDHGYLPGGLEAAVRGRSLIPPKNNGASYRLLPVEICTTVEADGSGALVLPCPRDVMDQMHLACRVHVVRITADAEQPVESKARIVYSKPAEPNGYVNPFVYVDLNNAEAVGPLEVRTLHWLVVADEYVTRQYKPALAEATEKVQTSIDQAAEIEYDIEVQIDEAGEPPTRGDCSVKAFVARNLQPKTDGLRVEVVEGYRFRLPAVDKLTGGCHFQNLVIGPTGLFMFDATTPHDYYVGVPDRFITTSVGGEFILPALGDPPGTIHRGSNMGFYTGFKSHGQARFSTPTFGERAEALAAEAKQPDPTIVRYAEALWQSRRKAYER